MDFLPIEQIGSFLSKAAQDDLTEKIIIIGICFWYIHTRFTKTFKGLQEHMEKIEKTVSAGFSDVAKNVADLTKSMVKLEANHSHRIELLEERVETITQKMEE